MEVNESQLEAMGLQPKRGNTDEYLGFSSWARKLQLHTAVKAQTGTSDKPQTDEWFRHEKGTTCSEAVRCNICVHIIKVQATVTAGNTNGTDRRLPDEYYLCKKETGVWSLKHLTSAEGSHKHATHLKHAADPQTYSVPSYTEYIPTEVSNSTGKYIDLFFAKYTANNPRLTKEMCVTSFVSFKCDLSMDEDGLIDEHIREVHDVPGIPAMKPIQRIEVDAKQEFSLPDLLDIEIAGPDKQNTKVNSVYSRCVSRNVVNKTYNKSAADLVESRSQDFMLELKKRTNDNFFNRFKMHLAQELDIDVESDFTCKWSKIEKCLFKAMSAEQNTVRLAKFYDTDHTQFHSMPMELIINSVEQYVDTALGKSNTVTTDSKNRTICNYVYSIRRKYELIFEIARHLNSDFKIIKEYIMQLCTKMHDNQKELMDITDFQTHLRTIFETKGVLIQFKNENIPAQKKSMSVNESKIKKDNKFETIEETPELDQAFKVDFKKYRVSFKEDNEIKKDVDTIAYKLAEDPANADLQVVNHEQIQSLLTKKKKKVCWSCRRPNCLSSQICSKKLKLKKRYIGKCDGKPITFKQLKASRQNTPAPKANESTARITPPPLSVQILKVRSSILHLEISTKNTLKNLDMVKMWLDFQLMV